MGCCSSSIAANMDTTFRLGEPQRIALKRSYSSRLSSDASSGVFSRCTTPSRRSIASGRSTPTRKTPATMSRANNFNYQNVVKKDLIIPKAFEKLAICDDFGERAKISLQPPHQQVEDLERSFGYFSEGISNGSCSSGQSKLSHFRTKDISARDMDADLNALPVSDLAMEMYMISHTRGIMPKTSSPALHRRERTYDAAAGTASYQKWRHYLQSTPAYMLHDVTCIPEAIAGHFSPPDFPAFTDLNEDTESAAKRYKMAAVGLTHTIRTSTEL